jgi:hypothetical protein
MRDDPLVRRSVAGVTEVISAHLPAAFDVGPGRTISVRDDLSLRPDAVVVARSLLRRRTLAPEMTGTAVEIGRGRRSGIIDRLAYEAAGVLCVWRIEMRRRPGYRGPIPVIFVRARIGAGWRERFILRGSVSTVPLCLRTVGAEPLWISIPVDPGWLAV